MKGRYAMRIAMIAPLTEAIPPRTYGGTERVVSLLTEEMVRRGHQVTLFASGDSQTDAALVACCPRGLRLDPTVRDVVSYIATQLDQVYRRAEAFDCIHNHIGYLAFPVARHAATSTVTTSHGRFDFPEMQRLCNAFPDAPRVAISDAQRALSPGVNWLATVYNGIRCDEYHLRAEPGDYLVFLGRISPEKRPDRAIEIARDVGMRLVIAAKVDPVDAAYHEQAIAPMIRACPLVEFIGEVNEREKDALLGGAYAYLFPIDWPEPFGLTMVEAMATGTPVIAYRAGSVPEVVVDGVTGFVCDTLHDMIEAVARIPTIDRRACRAHVEAHFSAAAMADGYERVYRTLAEGGPIESNGYHAWGESTRAVLTPGPSRTEPSP
jgi:glycosyltransferase involved in cell wall biosynthesis